MRFKYGLLLMEQRTMGDNRVKSSFSMLPLLLCRDSRVKLFILDEVERELWGTLEGENRTIDLFDCKLFGVAICVETSAGDS